MGTCKIVQCVWIYIFTLMHCNCQTTTLTPAVADVIEGRDVTLVCKVKVTTTYTTWETSTAEGTALMGYQSGTCLVQGLINDTNKYAYACNSTVYQLTIHNVQRSQHNDNWTCVAGGYTNGSTSIIKVKDPPSTPSFKVNGNTISGPISFIEGKTRSIQCVTESNPAPQRYTWTKANSSPVNGQNRTFRNVQQSDAGRYSCEVQNTMNPLGGGTIIGNNTSSVSLQVLYPPRIAALTNASLGEGATLDLTCLVHLGNPVETSIKWTRDNDNDSWIGGKLHIESISRDDAGTYTCTASNVMVPSGESIFHTGKDRQSFTLNVLHKAKIMSFIVVGFDEKEVVILDERADITLKCNVDSNPTSKVMLIVPTGFTYHDMSDLLVYTRHTVECFDAGIYLCAASNNYNDGIASYKLLQIIVRCSPRPAFDINVNRTAMEQESFTFAFTVAAFPVPNFKWLKFSENIWSELRNNNDNIQISTSGLEANLTILQVGSKDYGLYKLILTNEIGSFEQLFRLTRPDLPETPMNFRQLQAYTTQSTIKLAWEPGFDGGLTQTFDIRYKTDSEQMWNSGRLFDNSEATMNYTLTGLESETKYNIIIYALNRVGKSLESRMIASTKAKETDCSTGIVIGAAIGGIIVGVILSVVVICAATRFGRSYFCVNTVKKQESFENNPQSTSMEDVNYGDHDTLGASEYEHIGERTRREVYTTLESDPDQSAAMKTYENMHLSVIQS